MPGLQRLSQYFQNLAIKLWQFIEEQHAMVGEGDLAGLRFRATVTIGNRCNCDGLKP